ncbi:MAG: UDP-N-acetylmuramoylalanine--D-glutamate ligase [Gemmatimonadetes bacterium]|nr:UDP-N-acetylmuramoylalanine--D-glutamate ligase [Gemmatimonadota bacterium]
MSKISGPLASSAHVSAPAMDDAWLTGEVAVLGLGRSGRSVATLLARTGSRVYASDGSTDEVIARNADALREEGVDVEVGGHDLDRIRKASLVVASPGIPPEAAPIAAAHAAGVPLVGEIEIALRFLPHLRYIAITGTNGKTTTTAMIAHLLRGLRLRAEAAGNIGTPLAEFAGAAAPPDWVALELSSFQLHDTPSVRPRVGVLTNLSANHLDRYADAASYFGDKALMFRNASAASLWVSNLDDAEVQAMVERVPGLHAGFSTSTRSDAWYDRGADTLVVLGETIIPRGDLALLGDHNVANALAACLAVMLADEHHRTPESIERMAKALRSFRALEHRIETVGEWNGVQWINDSKSTNIASTLVALRGMHAPTILLLGGKHKGEPYTALIDEAKRTVKRVIAYGEAMPLIAADLEGSVEVVRAGSDFEAVVRAARDAAVPGDVVLLSPACSSYDMFDHYEHRGAEFKRIAAAIASR